MAVEDSGEVGGREDDSLSWACVGAGDGVSAKGCAFEGEVEAEAEPPPSPPP